VELSLLNARARVFTEINNGPAVCVRWPLGAEKEGDYLLGN
jgi:hypothetical protein